MDDRELLVIGAAEVRQLLPMDRCIDLMEQVLRALARAQAVNPLRTVVALRQPGTAFAVMPAAVSEPAIFGVKAISVFPGNRALGIESHQGMVLLFEGETGAPVAVVDAGAITEIRTAAVSAVATRLLARSDAGDLAILGSGTQARSHLEAMTAVRSLRRVRAWSPNAERLAAFVATASEGGRITVEAAASARDAVEGADLVCTVTASREPVLEGAWLRPGVHVNAVGASVPTARELDSEAVRRSRLFVDRRESAAAEAGDYLVPLRAGAIGQDHIVGEIGEVLVGAIGGRRADDEVTVFKSLGLAVEDVVAAAEVVRAARATRLAS